MGLVNAEDIFRVLAAVSVQIKKIFPVIVWFEQGGVPSNYQVNVEGFE